MGLLSKLKGDRKAAPGPYTHGPTRTAELLSGSEFLHVSSSSYSSQDTSRSQCPEVPPKPAAKRASMPLFKPYAAASPQGPSGANYDSRPDPRASNRHSLAYAESYLPQRQSHPQFHTPQQLPPPFSPQQLPSPLSSQYLPAYPQTYEPERQAASNGYCYHPDRPVHGYQNPRRQPQQLTPDQFSLRQSQNPHPTPPLAPQQQVSANESYPSLSESESDDASTEEESVASAPARRHPYYEQWKLYYQALENMKHKSGGPQAPTVVQPPSSAFYEQAQRNYSHNSLISHSRRSTIKSNRSASVPLLDHPSIDHVTQTRAVSINATQTLPEPFHHEGSSPPDETEEREVEMPRTRPLRLVAHGLSQLALEPDHSDQISDYAAYILDDYSEEEESINDETLREVAESPQAPGIPTPASKYLAPPPEPVDPVEPSHGATYEDVNRQNSTVSNASTRSYNSLRSETHFNVGKSIRVRPTEPQEPRKEKASRHKKANSFTPPFEGPPPPLQANPQAFDPLLAENSKRHSTGQIIMTEAYMNQILQQLQQLQQIQQFQQMQQYQHMHRHSMPSLTLLPMINSNQPKPVQRSSDRSVNNRIDEFVTLRTIIASGKKSLEFRLKWLKMLITATNYKLYAYINIKGETVKAEEVAQNKHFFVKSTTNHLQKLLKELEKAKGQEKIVAEVYYLTGCLHNNSFVEKFGQDFGFELDIAEAERYLQLSMEKDPTNFKAYYEMGELYESQQSETKFDMAYDFYKTSAQMGYNRAIYKFAMIHLLVPKMRLIKFFHNLKKLAEIDMDSGEIQLSGLDRDELEEVVGAAQYQLGKVYEGLYPGDLGPDDPFVKALLDIAPVNYSKSLGYYNKAAKLACLQAQVRLGRVYEDGDLNREANASKSIQWYLKASTSPLKFKRHPEAMLGVSRWYLRGSEGKSKHIPEADSEKAVQWCERASREFEYPEAFYQMGLYAEQGLDDGDAFEWFEKAASMGHAQAIAKLNNA